jgi:hypothetical protein
MTPPNGRGLPAAATPGRRSRRWALGLAILSASLAVPAAAQTGVVRGFVVDAQSGAPLPHAEVVSPGAHGRVTTDEEGRFVLRDVEKGTGAATVHRVGYDRALVSWELRGDTVEVVVPLPPIALALEEIKVTADRLDAVVQAAAYTVWRLDGQELAHSTASDAVSAIGDRFGLRPVPCRGLQTSAVSGPCYRVRGTPQRVCVLIDEAPAVGGLDQLRGYAPADLARIYLVRGGTTVVAYTRAYLAAAGPDARFASVEEMATTGCGRRI